MELLTLWIAVLSILFIYVLVLFCFNIKYWKPHFINPHSLWYLSLLCAIGAELVWRFVEGTSHFFINYICNAVYIIMMCMVSYFWLLYMMDRMPSPMWKKSDIRMLFSIPLIISAFLTIASIRNKLVFFIDSSGYYQRGPLFFVQLVPFLYASISTGMAIYALKSAERTEEKNKYMTMATLAIPVMVMAILQLTMLPTGLPTNEFGISIALLVLFIRNLSDQVTVDSLTGLDNRLLLDNLLAEKILKPSKNKELFLIIGDIDNFKRINDTFGHTEGDRALKMVGETLSSVCLEWGAKPSRMGGDEFAVVAELDSMEDAEKIKAQINESLAARSVFLNYEIRMSMGIAQYKIPLTVTQFIAAADKEQYRVKAQRKALEKAQQQSLHRNISDIA